VKKLEKFASSKFWTPSVLFVSEFLYLARIHTWEVDAHHDGIILAAAVAAGEGLIPHRDFFAQYGPLTPLLQGFFLRITEYSLFNVKILTSFTLALIGLQIFLGVRRRWSSSVALLASICWLLTGPFGLPWPSVFSTLIITSSLLIFDSSAFNRLLNSQANFSNFAKVKMFMAGLILGSAIFFRVHLVVTVGVIILIFLFWKFRRLDIDGIGWTINGILIAILTIVFYLTINGALYLFWLDCIEWASNNYIGSKQMSRSLFIEYSWPFLLGATYLIHQNYLRMYMLRSSLSKALTSYLILHALALCFLVEVSELTRSGPQTLSNPKILAITISTKLSFIFIYVVLTFFLLVLVRLLHSFYKEKSCRLPEKGIDEGIFHHTLLMLIVGVTSLLQLYPTFDDYHIAFITPVLILVASFIYPMRLSSSNWKKVFIAFCLLLLPSMLYQNIKLATIPRTAFQAPILVGMYGSWPTKSSIDLTMANLDNYAKHRGVRNVCPDGLYAASSAGYLASGRDFVSWGPKLTFNEANVTQLFLCYISEEAILLKESQGWRVVFKVQWNPMTGPGAENVWNVLFEQKT